MFISGSPTVLRFPSSTPASPSEYDPFSSDAICANLTSTMTMDFDVEGKRRRHGAICVAYNPTSALLAVATPIRLRILLGKASNHVLLGDVEERLGKLEGGPSLLWKHVSEYNIIRIRIRVKVLEFGITRGCCCRLRIHEPRCH